MILNKHTNTYHKHSLTHTPRRTHNVILVVHVQPTLQVNHNNVKMRKADIMSLSFGSKIPGKSCFFSFSYWLSIETNTWFFQQILSLNIQWEKIRSKQGFGFFCIAGSSMILSLGSDSSQFQFSTLTRNFEFITDKIKLYLSNSNQIF